jgi:hypothetical protein
MTARLFPLIEEASKNALCRKAASSAILATAAAMLVFGFSGCGPAREKLWPVSGKVTFRGKPVAAGAIRFSNPQIGIDMTAELHADGAYEVVMANGAGLPEGTYQVAVMPPRVNIPIESTANPPKRPPCLDIPERYRLPSTSRLTLTVKRDRNRFDVDMAP